MHAPFFLVLKCSGGYLALKNARAVGHLLNRLTAFRKKYIGQVPEVQPNSRLYMRPTRFVGNLKLGHCQKWVSRRENMSILT